MELSDYRKELDSIDAQMLELFKQRMNTVRGVAEYKKENKLPVLQQGREREILAAAAAGQVKSSKTTPAHFSRPSWMSAALIRRD